MALGAEMNLATLDLNLVVALRALLEERGVTRAARRVGLSQPAMSAALARLRRHFDDELLARVGGAYELTPLGAALLERTGTACDLLERVFSSQAEFDPANDRREFTLLGTDYGAAVFGPHLAQVLHREAPGVRLTFQHATSAVVDDTGSALSTVDGLLMPHGIIDGFPAVELFQDRWVCVTAPDNPEVGEALTISDLGRLPWVVYQRPYDAPAARQLSMIGISPRVEVSVQSFQLIAHFLAGTQRVALLQERLANLVAGLAPIRILPCPFAAVPVQEALWWHPLHTRDAAHIWLRETAARVGRLLGGPKSAL
jgi:DNA-binding transcriptional LysR family regulator